MEHRNKKLSFLSHSNYFVVKVHTLFFKINLNNNAALFLKMNLYAFVSIRLQASPFYLSSYIQQNLQRVHRGAVNVTIVNNKLTFASR